MIVIRIIGGLGNQLFQYAAARALSLHHNTQLKLDISAFEDYKLRGFELDKLNTSFEIATPDEIKALIPSHNLEKAFQYLSPKHKRTYYRERNFSFNDQFFKLGDHVYLKGYFQSEKYFVRYGDVIINEFTFKKPLPPPIEVIRTQIRQSPSVSIHVRRGDLLQDPESHKYHGMLTADYYQKSISYLKQQLPSAQFFVFSDDMTWTKQNLQIENATYVEGTNHLQDFQLMRSCHHNIIANSSFSWWAAWLNNFTEKMVIAPKNWFNEGPKDTQDLLPEGWIRL